jgi:sugar lactone lactonase YvrE
MLSNPQGMAVTFDQVVYIADAGNQRVRKVDNDGDHTITTLAGSGLAGFAGDGGPATAAKLNDPQGVAVDDDGNVFIADRANRRVRKVTPGGTISTVAGTGVSGSGGDGGPGTSAQLVAPESVATDINGNVFIADSGAHRVRKLTPGGTISTIAGTGSPGFSGDGAAPTSAQLNGPKAVAVERNTEKVFIADTGNNRIRAFSPAGTIATVAGNGSVGFSGDGGAATSAAVDHPSGVAVPSNNQDIYLAQPSHHRVRVVGGPGYAPSWSTNTPTPTGSVGASYSYAFSALANPAATYTVASGSLPPGTSLNATTGELSGTPTTTGSFTFTVRAANGYAPDAVSPSRTITISPTPPGSLYTAVAPTRLLDTRTGTGGPASPFGPAGQRDLQVTGGVVPTGATAVVLNVTVTQPTGGGYLTVFPAGVGRPLASNLNFGPGDTIPNLVTVGIGAGGKVSIYNDTANVHVIADVVGYYGIAAGGTYTPILPTRILDTRNGTGGPAVKFRERELRTLTVTGGQVPDEVTAVVLNVTVTGPTEPSFLTLFPDDIQSVPLASNLNFVPGQTIPNLVIVGVPAGYTTDQIDIVNDAGSVHVIADIVGFFTPAPPGGRLVPVTPTRLVDTRSGNAVGQHDVRDLVVRGAPTAIPPNATAVVLNVTVTQPTVGGYLTVFPGGTARPLASNLNFGPGFTIPNLVMVGVGTSGAGANKVSFYNDTGSVHLIADVVGYFVPS